MHPTKNLPSITLLMLTFATTPTFAQAYDPVLVEQPRPARAQHHNIMPNLQISKEAATKVGHQVWRNETGGDRDAITAWNASENFMSLGIGHFIWFAEGQPAPFQESFPEMLDFLRARGATPPAWLDKTPVPPCPWNSRAEFRANFNGDEMKSLRTYLLATVGLQAQFLALRMQGALPKMLDTVDNEAAYDHIRDQFNRIATASPDLYPLIDYVNFKGEGISETEVYPNHKTGNLEGWGLKHVLLEMRGTSTDTNSVLNDFANAAALVLKRRVQNNPPNKRWLKGWLSRVESYRKPLR